MKNWVSRVLSLAVLLELLTACNFGPLDEAYTPLAAPKVSSETALEIAEAESHQAEGEPTKSTASIAEAKSPPASLIEDLKTILATELGIASTEVLVQEATAVEWSDSCLDIPHADEFCAQVITPGYRIILSTLSETFEFHTDRSGRNIRRIGG